jgi:hypothetical protein
MNNNKKNICSLCLFALAVGILGSSALLMALQTAATTTTLIQIAEAQTRETNHLRMVWLTTRSPTAQRDLANKVLGGGGIDSILFHYGVGQDPTQAQIDAMKQVTVISDKRKGFEFFSLAEMAEHAKTAYNAGFRLLSYNIECCNTPQAELNDIVGSTQKARSIARSNGLNLVMVPSNGISSGQYADDIADLTIRYHLQAQAKQNADTTCTTLDKWVDGRTAMIERVNANMEGRITFQLSLVADRAAPGKTPFQTVKDCIDKVEGGSGSDVDGLSIWWTGASWDDGTYRKLLEYYESKYS